MKTRFLLGPALAAALALGAVAGAHAADADTAKPAAKKAVRHKPASSHQQLQSEAKGLALAIDTTEAISASQLEIAQRVQTGRTDCEFNQNVDVDAVPEHPGYFRVAFGKHRYTMVPEETTTGAVRLVDRKAGAIWLQIPVKSMLIDTKGGHRLVDACRTQVQRAAEEASRATVKTSSLE